MLPVGPIQSHRPDHTCTRVHLPKSPKQPKLSKPAGKYNLTFEGLEAVAAGSSSAMQRVPLMSAPGRATRQISLDRLLTRDEGSSVHRNQENQCTHTREMTGFSCSVQFSEGSKSMFSNWILTYQASNTICVHIMYRVLFFNCSHPKFSKYKKKTKYQNCSHSKFSK